jgi:hypothetical protein
MTQESTPLIVWFIVSALWVLLSTFAMGWSMPDPQIVDALTQSNEPARSAAKDMWMAYHEQEFRHLAKWTVFGFVPPLVLLAAGFLKIASARRYEDADDSADGMP